MPNRSRRWVSEMEEIAKTYNSLGITPKMYEGAAEFYRFVGGSPLAEETAETMDPNRTLKQVIEQIGDVSAQAMLDSILLAIEDFVGEAPPTDDLTLIVIRRTKT